MPFVWPSLLQKSAFVLAVKQIPKKLKVIPLIVCFELKPSLKVIRQTFDNSVHMNHGVGDWKSPQQLKYALIQHTHTRTVMGFGETETKIYNHLWVD